MDYRYFPCPDLLPVLIDDAYIDAIRATLPELPDTRRARFVEQYGLTAYDAAALSGDTAVSNYFEAVASACGDAKLSANWIMGELSARLNSAGIGIASSPVGAAPLAGLILRIKDNTISSKIAKQVFDAMWAGEGDADAVIAQRGLKQVSDSGALEKIVDEIIAANAGQVEQYRAADEGKQKKLLGFFVGQIMKASKGQANPGLVNEILTKKLNG
jgi:aspartyl-tRNA(Asn)/glutamyl-tRNA(Gln) amidotransferase subunit B